MVSEEEAHGRVAEIYAEIKEALGTDFVPNLYKVMAVKPSFLETNWNKVQTEPPRVFRRLQILRGWSHENDEEIFPGSTGADSSHGAGEPGRIRVTVGGDDLDCGEGWLHRTLRKWVRQHERDQGVREGLTTDDRKRLKELERENRELRRANEILKTASAFFAQAELDRKLKK
jgi:hypothetical protein